MSTKYETELKKKKDRTLFCRDFSSRSKNIVASGSRNQLNSSNVEQETSSHDLRAQMNRVKKERKNEIKRQREVLKKLKIEVENRQAGNSFEHSQKKPPNIENKSKTINHSASKSLSKKGKSMLKKQPRVNSKDSEEEAE